VYSIAISYDYEYVINVKKKNVLQSMQNSEDSKKVEEDANSGLIYWFEEIYNPNNQTEIDFD